jgi:hypothetical protein
MRNWPNAEKRLWQSVDKTDGCWNWTGRSLVDGYGKIWVNGRRLLTHRFSWQIHNGEIPPDMRVCHKCDNPKCVNPSHLFLGTQFDNMRDMESKGRGVYPHGSRSKMAVLAERDIPKIIRLHASGITRAALAKRYSVSWPTIERIVTRSSWKHVDLSEFEASDD